MSAGVFVSYSHENVRERDEFLPHLKPLERDGLATVWVDTGIQPGEEWRRKIDDALASARLAVLMVTKDFLASDFIWNTELPAILARKEAGELEVLPVFLGHCMAETEIPYTNRAGEARRSRLSDWQGIGAPDEPLSMLAPEQRDREYLKLARRIRALAEEHPPATLAPAGAQHWPGHARPAVPEGAADCRLTVSLERSGPLLTARYQVPGPVLLSTVTRPWEPLAARLEPLGALLDRGSAFELDRALGNCGGDLFDALFGGEEHWEPMFRTLFHQPAPGPRPNPILRPVRLRICTDEPSLLGLPWRLTAWKTHPLIDQGWTFMTAADSDPSAVGRTAAPSAVLLVTPSAPKALEEAFDAVWPRPEPPGYLRAVRTGSQLRNALSGMRPHLVYIEAALDAPGGRPSLTLPADAGPEPLPIADLALWMQAQQPPPAVLYLNVELAASAQDLAALALQILGPAVPLVLIRRCPVRGPEASSLATAWLRRWLETRQDPVQALHEVGRGIDGPESATLLVHAHYRDWQTDAFRRTEPRQAPPHLVLDRDEPKALVRKHLAELVRSDQRRVIALVAYAAPGNLLEKFRDALQYYLDMEAADLTEINWLPTPFPLDRHETRLRDNIDAELRLHLEADSAEPLRHLFRRKAPSVTGFARRPVLWLDFGVFGRRAGLQPPLTAEQLKTWLRYCAEVLSSDHSCPADLRIAASLAIEADEAKHPALRSALSESGWEPWCKLPSFRLTALPALGRVDDTHLYDYLVDGHSGCPAEIQRELTALLVRESGGDFQRTIALLQEGHERSWYDLYQRLRAGPTGPAPAADFEF